MIHDGHGLFFILAGHFHELLQSPDMLFHQLSRIDPELIEQFLDPV